MKVVGDNYIKSTESANVEEILERFEEGSKTVVNQKLSGAKSVCERLTQYKSTGNYKYYIALELSGGELVSKYNEVLAKDEAIKVDYNYEKFKKAFDAEMNKK
ncbi:hypothetical protein ElyMa_002236500 [Elysia marginata]|uniref:Cystatin domain-containing protein n=1 Tax=Elysia marginata TaxID=1093978 RepID=A0AAV4FWS0_9GAST|nr:hypothetical protein ElyMa_002236500 [Elysia marginata]